MQTQTRDGQTFAQQVPAATTDRIEWDVPQDGTIERVAVRIYTGAENTLRINIYRTQRGGSATKVVDTLGKGYIDGDDDVWEWSVSEPIERGEKILVEYDNTDGSNAHNFRCNIDVDYAGGLERVVDKAKGVLS